MEQTTRYIETLTLWNKSLQIWF